MMYIRQVQILVQAQICTWLIVYTKKAHVNMSFPDPFGHFPLIQSENYCTSTVGSPELPEEGP